MKLYCSLSGLELADLSCFKFRHLPGRLLFIEDWKASQLRHPVFALSRYELQTSWSARKFYNANDNRGWTHEDKQLWFLASCYATGLVQISHAQLPPYKVAIRYHNRVFKFLAFLDSVASPRIASRLPGLHISKSYDWGGFDGWLSSLEEARKDWEDVTRSRKAEELRSILEAKVERKLQESLTGSLQPEAVLPYFWKLIENELPSEFLDRKVLQSGYQSKTRTSYPEGAWTPLSQRSRYCYYKTQGQLWQELFCCTKARVDRGDFDRQDIEDLAEQVLTYIDPGSIASHHIHKRLTELHLWLRESREFVDSLEILGTGAGAAEAASKKEAALKAILASPEAALTSEPKQSDYPSEVAWLIAKVKYQQAQKAKKQDSDEPVERAA